MFLNCIALDKIKHKIIGWNSRTNSKSDRSQNPPAFKIHPIQFENLTDQG